MVAGDVSLEVISNRVMAVSLTGLREVTQLLMYSLVVLEMHRADLSIARGDCFFSSRAFYMGEATRKMSEERFSVVIKVAGLKRS